MIQHIEQAITATELGAGKYEYSITYIIRYDNTDKIDFFQFPFKASDISELKTLLESGLNLFKYQEKISVMDDNFKEITQIFNPLIEKKDEE